MKEYKKSYENVFTADRVLNRCKIWKVTADLEMDELKYRKLLRNVIKNHQKQTFDTLVKFIWLVKKFCYNGRPRTKLMRNGKGVDATYGIYMRHFVGFDNKIITRNLINSKVINYLDDFFPDLYFENPFEKKFKYPYSYMNFECLFLVYQMPERLELLGYGEKHRMRYTKFIDYVINYALSKSDEEKDKDYFTIAFTCLTRNPFVKYKHYESRK